MTAEATEGEPAEEPMNIAMSDVGTEPTEEMTEVQPMEPSGPAPPQAGGRRTQLKIVRESVQSLAKEVGSFRKSHEASTKKLEAHLASLRKDMTTHMRSKDLDNHAKRHQSDTKRLEKQIAALRSDLAALKGQMAKEAAKSRAAEAAALSKIVGAVKSAKPKARPRPSKKKR